MKLGRAPAMRRRFNGFNGFVGFIGLVELPGFGIS